MPLTARNTSSLVIDSLCDEAGKEYITVAGFYCDFLSQQDQTITNINYRGNSEAASRRRGHPGVSRGSVSKGQKEFGGRGPRLANLMEMLRIVIASIPQVFICLDALDEFFLRYLPELPESLGDIVREYPRTRLFLTGRPHVRGG